MFESSELENVPCPDPTCWRGFVCPYKHDGSFMELQKVLTALLGENNGNNTTSTDSSSTSSLYVGEGESSPMKQRLDVNDDNINNTDNTSESVQTEPNLDIVAPSVEDPSTDNPSYDFENPSPAFGNPSYPFENPSNAFGNPSNTFDNPSNAFGNSSNAFENSSHAFGNPSHAFGNSSQSGKVPRGRLGSGGAPARPASSMSVLRASIADVGRELSKLTRATSMPRTGGSLGTRIGDVEKQLSNPAAYRPRKITKPDIPSPTALADLPNESTSDISNEDRKAVRPKTNPYSKPIPSIQNKFLINPPIQTNKISLEETKKRKHEKKVDGKRVLKRLRKADVESSEEEDSEAESADDSDAESDESEEGDEEEEEVEAEVIHKKPTNKTILIASSKPNVPNSTTATATATTITTTNTTNSTTPVNTITKKPTSKLSAAALAKINAAKQLVNTKPPTTTPPPDNTPKVKKPSLVEVGVTLTPQQLKAVQKLRVDTDKKFAGLSASEYPTILFEMRPKVPRGVRQSYLDKFLVKFLENFPDNKAQAIEAAVKVESDIYSEAGSKMVYANLCVHKMRTLFPTV